MDFFLIPFENLFVASSITPMKKALVVYHAKDYDHLALQRHELSLSL